MATLKKWEFDCPQFVDFNDVGSSPKAEDFYGGSSPGLRRKELIMSLPDKSPKQEDPPVVFKTPFRRYPNGTNTTDSQKIGLNGKLSKRFSKSDGSINVAMKIVKPSANVENSYFERLKRTASESGLRYKPKPAPATPMCLKRTLCKSKAKKIKTTEELELEKIAQLQMQTKMHLQANKLTMMRQRQKPCGMQKETSRLDFKVKDNRMNAQREPRVMPKVNIPEMNITKKYLCPPNPRGIPATSKKILNQPNPFGDGVSKPLREINHWNKLNPTRIWGDKDGNNPILEKSLVKNYEAHSGITLSVQNDRNPVPKPFNFPVRPREFGLTSNLKKWKDNQTKRESNNKGFGFSFMRTPLICDKENLSSRNFYSTDGKIARQPKMSSFQRTENQMSKISKEV